LSGGPALDTGDLVRRLGLVPHPEGGFYRETFRSPLVLHLPDGRTRPASTAILYLLPSGSHSAWHRVASDEVWHHYVGGALRLHQLGAGERRLDPADPQAVVPAGVWQAAEPVDRPVLCGCTVAPGFDFADFEMGDGEALVRSYPADAGLIRRLAR
jgi:predicted cupin superfamily sugar epimerase